MGNVDYPISTGNHEYRVLPIYVILSSNLQLLGCKLKRNQQDFDEHVWRIEREIEMKDIGNEIILMSVSWI